jgi:serpin B
MKAESEVGSVDTEAPVAATDDAFGTDLYMLLSEQARDAVFSPASVAAALQMALCGARGETAAELAAALHLTVTPDGSPDGAADAAAESLRALSELVNDVADGGPVTFRMANTAWIQSGLPLLPEFTARLRDAASAKLEDADFADAHEAARAEINRVIEEQTEGKITDLLAPGSVNRLTRLVLANAVYLKAPWAEPFPEKATRDAPFYPDGPGGASLKVPMMHGAATRDYLRADGYQAVLLPYQQSRLAMAVVLPDGPLADLRPKIAVGGLRGLLNGRARHQVTLSMPRFRVESAYGLIPVLQQLGVHHAFNGTADFSGMTKSEQLNIGAIAHKAYIDVDENGTEAAAATAVVMRLLAAMQPPPRVEMVVDRPFLFAIIDTPTGLPLFLGQVTSPRTDH